MEGLTRQELHVFAEKPDSLLGLCSGERIAEVFIVVNAHPVAIKSHLDAADLSRRDAVCQVQRGPGVSDH